MTGPELSAAKRELLERWRAGSVDLAGGAALRRRGERTAPLSFRQHRAWVSERMRPFPGGYNLSFCARLRAPVDAARLARCVDAVAARHETLRTRVVATAGEPRQVVDDRSPVRLEVTGLQHLPAAERLPGAVAVATAMLRTEFDLERGPLARVALFRLGPADNVLALVTHHIIGDGYSLGVVLGELRTAYERGESALPPLPIQFADFAAWERESDRTDDLEPDLDFWRERLADLPRLPLPTRPGAVRGGLTAEAHPVCLEDPLVSALRAAGRADDVTLFMTLLALLFVLLHQVSGRVDLSAATPTANRQLPETAGLIGFFTNTVIVRVRVQPEMTFRELVAAVRSACLAAFAHQRLPLSRIEERLGIEERDGLPLSQVMFVLQPPMPRLALAGAPFEPVELGSGASRYELSVHLWDEGDAVRGRFEASSDLFSGETVAAMRDHWARLALLLAGDRDVRIQELPPW